MFALSWKNWWAIFAADGSRQTWWSCLRFSSSQHFLPRLPNLGTQAGFEMACPNWFWNGFNVNLLSYMSSRTQWVFSLPVRIDELFSRQQNSWQTWWFCYIFLTDEFPPSVSYFLAFKRALKLLDLNWLWDSLQYQPLILHSEYPHHIYSECSFSCKNWWTLLKAADSWNSWWFYLQFSHDCISSSNCSSFGTQAGLIEIGFETVCNTSYFYIVF